MSYSVCHRHSSDLWDLALLWLCCRLAGVVPIQPLAWELPYAMGIALKRQKTKKIKNKKKKIQVMKGSSQHWQSFNIKELPILCVPILAPWKRI